MQIINVNVNDIKVADTHREPTNLLPLVTSIKESGQLYPVYLDGELNLLDGRRRLEACASLGHETVKAVIASHDELHRALIAIEANLTSQPYTVLEQSLVLAQQKRIYEALHPETRPVQARGGPGRGVTGSKKTNDILAPVFTEAAAKALRVAARTVQRRIEIGEAIVPEAVKTLRGLGEADNQNALRQISRLPPEQQVKEANKWALGNRPKKFYERPPKRLRRPEDIDLYHKYLGTFASNHVTTALERILIAWVALEAEYRAGGENVEGLCDVVSEAMGDFLRAASREVKQLTEPEKVDKGFDPLLLDEEFAEAERERYYAPIPSRLRLRLIKTGNAA